MGQTVTGSVVDLLGLDEDSESIKDARELVLTDTDPVFGDPKESEITDSELLDANGDSLADIKRVVDFAKDAVDDYKNARIVHQRLIDRGLLALDGMLQLAHGSNQPRAYEVVSTLITTVSNTTRDLIKLQESMHKMNEKIGSELSGTVNNNLIVSTTGDLAKILADIDANGK